MDILQKKCKKILVHDDSYLSQVYVPSFMNPPSVSEFSERNYGKQHFICSASPPDISIVKVGGKFNSFLEQPKKPQFLCHAFPCKVICFRKIYYCIDRNELFVTSSEK